MRLLGDTHAIYWFLTGDNQLSDRARLALRDPANDVLVSSVTGYELSLKASRGHLNSIVVQTMIERFRTARFVTLPITLEHSIAAGELPGPHRDPWDRILMAQARIEGLVVVTRDVEFSNYGVPTLW